MINKIININLIDDTNLNTLINSGTYIIKGIANINNNLPNSIPTGEYVNLELTVLNSSINSKNIKITQYIKTSDDSFGIYKRQGKGTLENILYSNWEGASSNGGSFNIEAEAPLLQKDGKLSLSVGDGLKVENEKLVLDNFVREGAVVEYDEENKRLEFKGLSDTSTAVNNAKSLALREFFVAAGAEYNDSNVDIIKTTPWAAYVDEIDFKAVNNIDVLNYTTAELLSIVQGGTTYNYVIDNGVYKVVGRASRGQIVHDERYCVHRAGHYYLNGLGDITEEQMLLIYNRTAIPVNKYISYFRMQNESDLSYIPRTNILSDSFFAGMVFENLNSAFYASPIEVFKVSGNNDRNFAAIPEFSVATLSSTFERSQMKYLIGAINIKKQSTTDTQYIGGNAPNLRVLLFKNLCGNLKTFNTAANISKSSIIYAINNSAATSAITITLHAKAYARLKDNPEVVAALANKPLVTLVSA